MDLLEAPSGVGGHPRYVRAVEPRGNVFDHPQGAQRAVEAGEALFDFRIHLDVGEIRGAVVGVVEEEAVQEAVLPSAAELGEHRGLYAASQGHEGVVEDTRGRPGGSCGRRLRG